MPMLCNAHSNYGEHGLRNGDPSGQPEFPTLSTGYFKARVTFALDLTDAFHENIFTIRNYATNEFSSTDKISFRRLFRSDALDDGIALTIDNTGSSSCRFEPGVFNIVSKESTTFTFGVRSSGSSNLPEMYIRQDDGPEIKALSPSYCLPTSVARTRVEIGQNMGSHGNADAFTGIVTGVELISLDESASGLLETQRHLSLHGQILGRPFTASFHAQWQYLETNLYRDDIRGDQHAFHYCNSVSGDCVWCGQDGIMTQDFAFEFTNGNDSRKLVAPNAIVKGEWALWHCSIESNGTMRISKIFSGGSLDWNDLPNPIVFPKAELHNVQYTGSSLDNGVDNLMWGAVLGLRIDIRHTS